MIWLRSRDGALLDGAGVQVGQRQVLQETRALIQEALDLRGEQTLIVPSWLETLR